MTLQVLRPPGTEGEQPCRPSERRATNSIFLFWNTCGWQGTLANEAEVILHIVQGREKIYVDY